MSNTAEALRHALQQVSPKTGANPVGHAGVTAYRFSDCRIELPGDGTPYTSAVTQCKTADVAKAAAEGAPLMAIQTNDPRITLVAGGYPLFAEGGICGGIGVGGGTEEQDCAVAEYVVSVFEAAVAK